MAIENFDQVTIAAAHLRPFSKFIMSIGELPTSYLDSLSYAEQVTWFCNFLQDKVIPAINNNAEALEEVQGLMTQLQEYVDNYFTNLDVQEEINNKLDNMVEQGVLQEIIADYLNSKAIFGYDNVTAMKESTNLINGSYAKTLGYHTKNDGGGSLYKIRTITNEDVIDNMFIISLDNSNTLIAELIIEKEINANACGLSPTLNDNTSILSNCINKAHTLKKDIFINSGLYTFTENISIPNEITIHGIESDPFNNNGTILYYTGNDTFITLNNYANLKNITIKGNNSNNGIVLGCCKIENVTVIDCNIGLQLGTILNSPAAYLENVFCYNCSLGFKLDSDYTDNNNKKYCQDTTLLKCRCNNCLNGFYINDYAIHCITINVEGSKSGGIPVELGANAKCCTILNSYIENANATKEMVINASAKYNEIKGFRYLGWYSQIQNNGDGTNIITCPSISNQTVQFEHGKKSCEYLGITAKDDYSSLYGIIKTSDSNITEGVTYGDANIFKNYDTKLIHRLENFTARNRTNATISNISVTQTITPNSINVASKGYQNISFSSSYFSTTANTKFIAMALTNSDLVINFYKNDNYLIMHIYNPTDTLIELDPIPVTVLCWEQ